MNRFFERSRLIAAAGLAALLVLGACAAPKSGGTPATTGQTTKTAAPAATPTGPFGTVKFGLASFGLEQFDPTKGAANEGLIMDAPILDPLLTLKGTAAAPGVADSWELAADGLSWVFRIRKGIKFHDGSDLTGKDVKFTIERYSSKDAYQVFLRNAVDNVVLVDDYTVRVNTKGPQPFLPLLMAYYYPAMGFVQPKDYIDKNGIDYFKANPVGSGPFKFVSHAQGDSLKFQAQDKHWRVVPKFKNLEILLIPEEATRIAGVKTGTLDVIDVGLDGAAQMEKDGLRTAKLASAQVYSLLWGAYVPEASSMPLANIKVRQALSLAINREEIAKNLFYGKTTPPLPSFIVEEAGQDYDLKYWQDQGAKTYAKYDPQRAKALLAEAGYANGFSLTVWSYSMAGGGYFPKLIETLASYWKAVGVKVDIFPTDLGSMQKVSNTLKFPTLRGLAGIMRVTGRPVAPQILSTYVTTTSMFALLGQQYPQVDTLVTKIFAETDSAKRKSMIAEVTQIVADAYVGLPIGGVATVAGIGPAVEFPAETWVPELSIYAERVGHRTK
ncbi:MAG: ABC transporter substrate-binding protein [Chloroflexi bacterium]|nr:ABC transporter substrate-binding protein [Chloroflexota bacterium]